MSELVTDALVDEAAEAAYTMAAWDAGNFTGTNWTELDPAHRTPWLREAEAALEVVAPRIAAKALRDFASASNTSEFHIEVLLGGSDYVRYVLRAYADLIEANAPASGPEKRTTPCSAVKPGHHCKRFDPHGDSHVWVATAKEEER